MSSFDHLVLLDFAGGTRWLLSFGRHRKKGVFRRRRLLVIFVDADALDDSSPLQFSRDHNF